MSKLSVKEVKKGWFLMVCDHKFKAGETFEVFTICLCKKHADSMRVLEDDPFPESEEDGVSQKG